LQLPAADSNSQTMKYILEVTKLGGGGIMFLDLSVCLCVRAFIRVQAFPGRPAVEFPSLPSAMCSFQPPKIGAYIAVYCMQPNNTELMNYGRLVLDGELKVKCDGEKSQMTRYVCGSKYKVGQKTGP